jgi:hypothetical protein
MSPPAGRQPGPVGRGRGLQALGGVLALVSCVPMVAMLPGAVATLLTTIGITTTSGPLAPVAQGLAPIARPAAHRRRAPAAGGFAALRRGPAVLAAVGGTLLYLSMYVVPHPSSPGMGGMAATSTPAQGTAGRAGAVGATNAPVFYLGLAAYLGTFLWSSLRRWRRACRPVRVTAIPPIGGTRKHPP